jgi:hypothetical protein
MGKLQLLLVMCGAACGCNVDGLDRSEQSLSMAAPTSVASQYRRPSEAPLVSLAQKVPEFGGYYCENGDLVVLLTASNAVLQSDVESMVDPKLISGCHDRQFSQHVSHVVFATSDYNFISLRQWRDALGDAVLSVPGVVNIGINYRRNRLIITARPEAVAAVLAVPALNGVPAGAYEVNQGDFPVQTGAPCTSTPPGYLYDCFHPVPGGVQFVPDSQGGCTIGTATSRLMGANWADGWVTASHCLPPKWRMDSVGAWQPWTFTENFIGTEAVDPNGFACGSRECRYSDSAWIQAAPADPSQVPEVGKIAHTDSDLGSSVIDQNYSRFSVRDYKYGTEGMEVHKMGDNTGWTYGHITDTCVDVNLTDPPSATILCQNLADYNSNFGDSGAPVFYWIDSGQWDSLAVDIVGIHWGLTGDGEAIYSPWDGVISDLGLIASNDPNMAAGATVLASSSDEEQGWGTAKVVDSNRKSVPNSSPPWSRGYSSTTSSTNHEEWVEIQLSSAMTVSKVVLYPRDDVGYVGAFFPVDFKIQVWNGTTWLDRVTETNFQKPDDSPRTFTWGFSDTTDRIRIDVTKLGSMHSPSCGRVCSSYIFALQFAEIEVYAS